MKTTRLFGALGLLVVSFASGLSARATTIPSWVRVDTITIVAIQNTVPWAPSVHRSYVSGNYRFSLDPTSPGISYSPDRPPNISAFLMMIDSGINAEGTHTYGLNIDLGPSFVIESSDTTFGVDAFIADVNISDNSGSVTIFVDRWQ